MFGYWLIAESITVIILFFSIFASTEIGLSTFNIGMILLFVQIIGIFSTWFGGTLADKHSNINLLGFSIVGWLIVLLLLVTSPNFIGLILITLITGLVIGNSQSYLRSQWSQIVRKDRSGFEFGLFAIASQASVIVGPVLFSYSTEFLGSQRIPLIVLGVTMIIGYGIVFNVNKKL